MSWSLLLQVALATEPSPLARCARAAEGTEVEICLKLALEYPDEVNGIAAALRAHLARQGSGNQDLLLALLALVDDQTAVEAAARMADMADPRAVSALVACAERRPQPISEACARGLLAFDDGLGHLSSWLVERKWPLELRLTAAQTLGQTKSEAAAEVLLDALRRPRMSAALRREILGTIRSHYPHHVQAIEGQVASDGRLWLSLGGGWTLGYALGSAGYFGQSELAPLGWATGAVAGGTTGWLYERAWPMEAGDAAYLTSGVILGSTSGMLLGSGLDATDADALYLGGLVGLAVGGSVTAATRTLHTGSGADAVEAAGVASLVALGAGSGAHLAEAAPETVRIASGAGLAGGTVLGHAIAPRVDLSRADGGLILLGSAWGLAVGTLAPGPSQGGLAPEALGMTSGALLAYGLAQPLEVDFDVQAAGWAGAAFGGAFGAGLGILVDPESDAPATLALGTGTVGLAVGAGLARLDPEPLDDRDLVLVSLATGYATWQSAGWAGVARPDARQVGWFVIAPALVGASTAAASPVLDVPVPQAAAATSLGLWGAYGGGVAGELARDDVLTWSLVGSNVGLVGGAILMSPWVGTAPLVVGVADTGGVLGASVGALTAAFTTDNRDWILTSSLVGAGVGFGAGAALGSTWRRAGTRDQARRPGNWRGRWLVRPDMGLDRSGVVVEVREW